MIHNILTTTHVDASGMLVVLPGSEMFEEVAVAEPMPTEDEDYGILSVKAAKKKADEEEDAEDDEVEPEADEKDDWEEGEEDDAWDPDFDEFDIPKPAKKGKAGKDEDDEVKFDEDLNEFDDLFGDAGGGDDFDDDDDF